MNRGQEQASPGIVLALIAVSVLAVLVGMLPSCMAGIEGVRKDAARANAEVDRWRNRCRDQGGQIVHNGKGSPVLLCFGRDGRLIASR